MTKKNAGELFFRQNVQIATADNVFFFFLKLYEYFGTLQSSRVSLSKLPTGSPVCVCVRVRSYRPQIRGTWIVPAGKLRMAMSQGIFRTRLRHWTRCTSIWVKFFRFISKCLLKKYIGHGCRSILSAYVLLCSVAKRTEAIELESLFCSTDKNHRISVLQQMSDTGRSFLPAIALRGICRIKLFRNFFKVRRINYEFSFVDKILSIFCIFQVKEK